MYITVHSTCGTICAPLYDQLGDPNGPLSSAVLPALPSSTTKGTRTVPFFIAALRGILYSDLVQEQERLTNYFWTQGPLYCTYFSKNHLWLVIVILKSLNLVVSCIPVLYYVYCICFMLFRSTCSWPFSEENPLRVASEALNIHLVSCILYLVSSRNI